MNASRPKYDTDLDTLKQQVIVETYRSGGPGGQRKNKTETAVRLKHLSTGVTVIATEHRSQAQNRELAFERLVRRLERLNQPKKRRIPTRTPRKALEHRIADKKHVSLKKKQRQTKVPDL
jgi:protein subunit release factor B